MFLAKIEFIKNVREFPKGFSIELKSPLTILVGVNGSGKSTILSALARSLKVKEGLWDSPELEDVLNVSLSKETPAIIDFFSFHQHDEKFSSSFGDDIMTQLQSMKASSGISTLIQFSKREMTKTKKCLCLIDEPCRGASPILQEKLAIKFLSMSLIGESQLILSTHSERIMNLANKYPELVSLYSVEHRRFFGTKEEFLEAHLKDLER